MNKIRFLSVAEQELREAVNYYNRQRKGLGYEFADEVRSTLRIIRSQPEA